jgi:hypothetical protein
MSTAEDPAAELRYAWPSKMGFNTMIGCLMQRSYERGYTDPNLERLLGHQRIDINCKNCNGKTELHFAVRRLLKLYTLEHCCIESFLDLLLRAPGIDPHCTNNNGLTPLHMTAREITLSIRIIFQLLLDAVMAKAHNLDSKSNSKQTTRTTRPMDKNLCI